jgi:signal transduction histidine kinase
VEFMGGTIGVESRVGAGTTFTVRLRLPLAAEDQFAERQLVGKEAGPC